MRINARIDDALAEQLQQLEAETGRSRSDLLRSALEAYVEQVRASRRTSAQVLRAHGFVGCAEAPSDLAATYKDELSRALERKHGHR